MIDAETLNLWSKLQMLSIKSMKFKVTFNMAFDIYITPNIISRIIRVTNYVNIDIHDDIALSVSKKCHKYKRRLLCLLIDFLSLSHDSCNVCQSSQSNPVQISRCGCRTSQKYANISQWVSYLKWDFFCAGIHTGWLDEMSHLIGFLSCYCGEIPDIIFIRKRLWRGDFDGTLSNLVDSTSRPQSACFWTFEIK